MSATTETAKSVGSVCTKGTASTKANLSACSHAGHQGQKVCEDEVRELAYKLWEAAGSPEGDGVQYWLEAETELTAP